VVGQCITSQTAAFTIDFNSTAFWTLFLNTATEHRPELHVCGSIHHNLIHIENPTRCHSVWKFYFIFMWSSTCFGRHTAHHQEPKTVLAASGFACVEDCWTCSCWMLSGSAYMKTWASLINATTSPPQDSSCQVNHCWQWLWIFSKWLAIHNWRTLNWMVLVFCPLTQIHPYPILFINFWK
jgi:hypothetical protein